MSPFSKPLTYFSIVDWFFSVVDFEFSIADFVSEMRLNQNKFKQKKYTFYRNNQEKFC